MSKLEMWGLNMVFVVGGDGGLRAAQVRGEGEGEGGREERGREGAGVQRQCLCQWQFMRLRALACAHMPLASGPHTGPCIPSAQPPAANPPRITPHHHTNHTTPHHNTTHQQTSSRALPLINPHPTPLPPHPTPLHSHPTPLPLPPPPPPHTHPYHTPPSHQLLSEHCRARRLPTCVVGVPKSIENDILLVKEAEGGQKKGDTAGKTHLHTRQSTGKERSPHLPPHPLSQLPLCPSLSPLSSPHSLPPPPPGGPHVWV